MRGEQKLVQENLRMDLQVLKESDQQKVCLESSEVSGGSRAQSVIDLLKLQNPGLVNNREIVGKVEELIRLLNSEFSGSTSQQSYEIKKQEIYPKETLIKSVPEIPVMPVRKPSPSWSLEEKK